MTFSPKKFRRSENGATTIETTLWIPVFFAFFALLFDIVMMFNGQAAALRIVQEANRDYSIGTISTLSGTRSRIKSNLASINITVSDGDIRAAHWVRDEGREVLVRFIDVIVIDRYGHQDTGLAGDNGEACIRQPLIVIVPQASRSVRGRGAKADVHIQWVTQSH